MAGKTFRLEFDSLYSRYCDFADLFADANFVRRFADDSFHRSQVRFIYNFLGIIDDAAGKKSRNGLGNI